MVVRGSLRYVYQGGAERAAVVVEGMRASDEELLSWC